MNTDTSIMTGNITSTSTRRTSKSNCAPRLNVRLRWVFVLPIWMNGKELFDVMLRVAHDYKLPAFVNRDWFADYPYLQESLGPKDIVLDHTITIGPEVPPEKWADFYISALKNLKPGVTEFVIHPGFDDEELRAATRERSTWGSTWRQHDFDFFNSDQFREILVQENIKLITWRELVRMAARK